MDQIDRTQLAHLPTPIDAMPRLTKHLGGPALFVKRDDQTGLGFGGNKTRKLEFLLADAKNRHSKTLITGGAVQSNHCRQTAAAAVKLGFECILILSGERPTTFSGNLFLDYLFNAKTIFTSRKNREAVMTDTFEKLQEEGKKPYLIPIGGSNSVGASAYAYAIQELLSQTPDNETFDWIIVASSSGGTQAGMIAGAKLFGYKGKILGVSIDESKNGLKKNVRALANETIRYLGEETYFTTDEVLVNADYLGQGYGIMGALEREAILLFAQYEGLLLDPVYTGRAAAGLIDLIRKGFFSAEERILFWHTGGTPALFAENYKDLI